MARRVPSWLPVAATDTAKARPTRPRLGRVGRTWCWTAAWAAAATTVGVRVRVRSFTITRTLVARVTTDGLVGHGVCQRRGRRPVIRSARPSHCHPSVAVPVAAATACSSSSTPQAAVVSVDCRWVIVPARTTPACCRSATRQVQQPTATPPVPLPMWTHVRCTGPLPVGLTALGRRRCRRTAVAAVVPSHVTEQR